MNKYLSHFFNFAVVKTSVIFLLLLSQISCGFHFRGQHSYPEWFNNVQINVPSGEVDLAKKLRLTLNQQDITTSEKSKTIINVNSLELLESTNKTSQNVAIILTIRVSYSLQNAGKTVLSSKLQRQLSYQYNAGKLLIAEAQRQRVKNKLLSEISLAILARIARN